MMMNLNNYQLDIEYCVIEAEKKAVVGPIEVIGSQMNDPFTFLT